MMRFPADQRSGGAEDEQPEHRQRHPRGAPVRRHAARRHVLRRRVLPLERPGGPAEDGQPRLLRRAPAVHHRPHRRRAEPRPATRLQRAGAASARCPSAAEDRARPLPGQRQPAQREDVRARLRRLVGRRPEQGAAARPVREPAEQRASSRSLCNKSDPSYSSAYDACCQLQEIALAGSSNKDAGVLRRHAGRLAERALGHPRRRSPRTRRPARRRRTRRRRRNVLRRSERRRRPSARCSSRRSTPSPGSPLDGRHRPHAQRVLSRRPRARTAVRTQPRTRPRATTSARTSTRTSGNARTFIAFQPDRLRQPASRRPDGDDPPLRHDDGGRRARPVQRDDVRRPGRHVIPNITPAALGISAAVRVQLVDDERRRQPGPDDRALRDDDARLHVRAADRSARNPGNFPFVSRYGAALGGIYHASPAVVRPARHAPPGPGVQRLSEHLAERASRSSTSRRTTACSTRSGPTRPSSRTTSAGRCSCPR